LKYVTRAHAKVDRIACPWLIKRFIDSGAEFMFVEPDRVLETAQREGAVPFDVPGVELGIMASAVLLMRLSKSTVCAIRLFWR